MDQISAVSLSAAAIGSLVVALLHCFLGYKLQRFWVALMAFAAGALIGNLLAGAFGGPDWVRWIAAIALGAFFVGLSFKVYLAGVFVLAFSLVFICAQIAIRQLTLRWIVIIVGGVLVGILAVKFTRTVLIWTTALGGGITAGQLLLSMTGVMTLMGTEGLFTYVPMLAGLVIGGFGVWVQYKTTIKGA